MKKLTKKSIKLTFILLFFIVVLALGTYLSITFFMKIQHLFNKNTYIPTLKRDKYVIQNVDDTLLSNYVSKDKNTLIVFWASWCQACTEEAEELNNFISKNPEICVLVVSFDKNITDLENYLSSKNYNWFVIFDTERKTRQSIDTDTKGIPATYLINNKLDVISKEISSKTEDEFLKFYNLDK